MHVLTPLHFPQGIRYCVVGQTPFAAHVGKILAKFCPRSAQVAWGDAQGQPDLHYVVCSPTWAQEADILRNGGVAQERILCMPLPEADVWSYWEFSKISLDDVAVRDGKVAMPTASFMAYIDRVCGRQAKATQSGYSIDIGTDNYCSFSRTELAAHREAIAAVMRALADDESRETYARVLSGQPPEVWDYFVRNTFGALQYFEQVRLEACRCVVNGGIFHGAEIPVLLAALPSDCVVHNVDPLGYDELTAYARASVEYFGARLVEHRLALAGHDGTMALNTHSTGQMVPPGAGGGIDTRMFPCLTIDTLTERTGFARHGFIKLDLEGGEPAAIRGMAQTVASRRPQLAISIYHQLDHMWTLPLALMELCRDYDFFVRHYSWQRWEVLLYCIPKELAAVRQ